MRKHSILTKILGIVAGAFLLVSCAVLLLAHFQLTAIIDSSQKAVYEEKLNTILRTLDRYEKRLEATGMRAAYEEAFQDAALKALLQTYYNSPEQRIYPFIFDENGVVVMHPLLPRGDKSLQQTSFIRQGRELLNGELTYTYTTGETKWAIFRHFPQWKWTVGYAVPLEVKYADARLLRNSLALILTLIVILAMFALSVIINRMIRPVKTLTKVSAAMADGDLEQEIDTSGKDELGSLARSFSSMRDSIRQTLTDFHNKNKELQESERRFRTFIDQAADAAFVHDFEGRLFEVNQRACESLGYERAELLKKTVMELDASYPTLEEVQNAWRDLTAKKPVTLQGNHRRKDNSIFPVEIRVGVLEFKETKTFLALARDITDRKNAEEELRKKEEQQSLILRTLPMAFYIARPFDNYGGTWVSEQIESLAGYAPGEFMEDSNLWVNNLHQKDKERVLIEFDRLGKTGVVSTEYRWRCKDGTYRWFHDEGVLVRDEAGKPREIIGTWLDITERRKEQEQLLLTRHSVDFGSTPTIWFKDSGQYYYANEAACTLTGYAKEELLALPQGSLHPTGDTEYRDKFAPTLRKERAVTIEIEMRKKSGDIFPVLLNATYFKFLEDAYVVTSFYDLTERRKLESELRQAQKMEAIGTLAGGIAHDFNNILSAIFGYTELAGMRELGSPKIKDDLKEIHRGAIRARDLVKQILTFSRQGEQERRPLQISLIVKEALKLLRSSIPTTIEIRQNIKSSATALADPTQIHQIIMNLCTNAYHAMKEKGGILSVELEDVLISEQDVYSGLGLQPGKYIRLEVSDTGSGMDKATREKIFEPYFTTKKTGEGTGLGLTVVHGIVQSHHGHITVYSEKGEGTVFHVYLPGVGGVINAQDSENISEVIRPGSGHIMFVDDEPQISALVSTILQKYGYVVTVCNDGSEALEKFQVDPGQYDLVITDMTMPKMTGLELADKILAISPGLPIILCSGFSEDVNRDKALALGLSYYIQKPLIISDLVNSIKKFMGQNNSHA